MRSAAVTVNGIETFCGHLKSVWVSMLCACLEVKVVAFSQTLTSVSGSTPGQQMTCAIPQSWRSVGNGMGNRIGMAALAFHDQEKSASRSQRRLLLMFWQRWGEVIWIKALLRIAVSRGSRAWTAKLDQVVESHPIFGCCCTGH